MQIKIWEYVVHDLNFSMRRMSQNANPSIAISGVFNKTIMRPNTTQTLMNISGMDYPHQVANNHLAKPTYIQTVDALLYCQDKRTMCTALVKLTVIKYLFCCPPTVTISQRTCLHDCVPKRVTLGTPASFWTAMSGAHHWIPKTKSIECTSPCRPQPPSIRWGWRWYG